MWFSRSVYQECLVRELKNIKVPFVVQPELTLEYKVKSLKQLYKPGFICCDQIFDELKALSNITGEHKAQSATNQKATFDRIIL